MPLLLQLDSSADTRDSRSRALTATFADAWRALGPDHEVRVRDLHRDPVPHLADAAMHWPERMRPADVVVPEDADALQRELIDELLAADVLLIGAPLYNYSVPSSLKAWIDHVHVPGMTAAGFGTEAQPLAGRPAVVVSSRGGAYDPGTPTADWDHAAPVLRIILESAFGMDLTIVTTSLTLAETFPREPDRRDRARAEFAAARDEAVALARRLGA